MVLIGMILGILLDCFFFSRQIGRNPSENSLKAFLYLNLAVISIRPKSPLQFSFKTFEAIPLVSLDPYHPCFAAF